LAGKAPGTESTPPVREFGLRDLWRLTLWGLAAGGALVLAVYAGMTETGRDRLMVAAVQAREIIHPTGMAPPRPLDTRDGQRFAEALRLLTADRDRVLARLTTLERSLDDVTASVARVEKAAQPAQQPRPEPDASAAVSAPPAEEVTSSIIQPPASMPMPPAVSDSPGKAEFGLDLGGANTLEGLRNLWATARSRHGPLLAGLRPVVHLRERPRPGAVDLRLVAGPIPNAATAARMCATLAAAGAICQPAAFDGQRLAVR
jgi:hypothetical protein